MNLKTVKLASTRYLDNLPTSGSNTGHAFRDLEMEAEVHKLTQADRRRRAVRRQVFLPRCPRHPPAAPRRLAADRPRRLLLGRPPGQVGKITKDGIFLEQLETDPAKYLPEIDRGKLSDDVVKIDLNQPMSEISASCPKHPIKTRCR
jgi:fumarate hydratase class I